MASTCVLTTLGIDFLNSFPSSVIIQSAVVEWPQTVRGGGQTKRNQLIFYFLPTPKTQKIGKKQKFNFFFLTYLSIQKIYLSLNIFLYIELRIKVETILLNEGFNFIYLQ